MRRGEVITGLILTLVAFSYVASLLLDFRFVSPYASPQEDVSYLRESIDQQLTSSIAWMITAALSFLAIPAYMLVLGKASRTLQFINAYGLPEFVERARELAAKYGERFEPPQILIDMAEKGETF